MEKLKNLNLKDTIAFKHDGLLFLSHKQVIDIIDQDIDEICIVDVSKCKLERQEIWFRRRWYVVNPDDENIVIKKSMLLHTIETFKFLKNYGLNHNYCDLSSSYLLNHLIQYEKPLSWDFLDYVLEDGLNENRWYNVNAMLSLVQNSENAKWLLSKGAKCCCVPGYGQTESNLLSSALVRKDNSVLNTVIDERAVDYDWLTSVNKDGMLNIDALMCSCYSRLQARLFFGKLLKDERIKKARNEWKKSNQ